MNAIVRELAIDDILDSYCGDDRSGTLRRLSTLGVNSIEADLLLREIDSDLDYMSAADYLDSL